MPPIWTTPRTWTAGELVTAAIANSAWRDEFMYLKDSPVFDGNVGVTGQLNVTGGLSVTGATTLGSTLNVTGDMQVAGDFRVGANLFIDSATGDVVTNGNVSVTGGVGVTGLLSTTSQLAFTTLSGLVSLNTANGADAGTLSLSAGGAAGFDRGALIRMRGNESPGAGGLLELFAGDAPGGGYNSAIVFYTGAQQERGRIGATGGFNWGFDGVDPGPGNLRVNNQIGVGAAIHANTADGADTTDLQVCGGGAVGSARGAFINLSGNEAGGSGQVHIGAGAGGLSRIVFSTFAGGDQIRGYIHPSGGFSWGTATDPGNTSMTIAGNLTVSSALLVNGPTNLTTLNVNAAGGNVSWGQYTPTLTPVSNLDGAVVAHGPWQFLRIGNNVFISGTALADPTAAGGTGTSFNFTLPIATNPLAQGDLSGVVSSVADNGIVQPLGAGGVPQAVWFSQITTQSAYCVVAQYRIV